MFKRLGLLFSLITLTSGVLFARDLPKPGSLEVSGDFVYLMPTIDDTYFVIDSPITTTFPNGERKNNDFDFRPGFRVGAAYAFCHCNRGLEVSYTYLYSKKHKNVAGNFLWATVGRADFASVFENYTGEASSALSSLYQSAEAKFVQQTLHCCGVNLAFQAGLEYAYFNLRENYEYAITTGTGVGTFGDVRQKCKTWGIGPQVGVSLDYELFRSCGQNPNKLSLFVGTSGSILTGETRVHDFNATTLSVSTTLLDLTNEDTWRIIPAFHSRVGLNYDIDFCTFGASLEVGYEFSTYLRGISRVLFQDDVADGLSSNNYYNYDLQGLYVSASVRF